MRKTILIVVLLVIVGFLVWSNYARAYEPKLHVAVSMDEAETYESVLVMVTSDPLPYGNNSTIASDHVVDIRFFNLGTSEDIYEGNLTLKSGTATWKFMVVPEWGEFTGIIEVYDPLIDSTATTSLEIEYSQNYKDQKLFEYIEGRENNRDEKSAKTNDGNTLLTVASNTMVWIILPLALLKLEHTTARKNKQESIWDRIRGRIAPYDESQSGETVYLTDERYTFPAHGRIFHEAEAVYMDYLEAEEDEAIIAYEQEQRRELLRKIDPKMVREITDPSVSLEDLKNEMKKQVPDDERAET